MNNGPVFHGAFHPKRRIFIPTRPTLWQRVMRFFNRRIL